MATWPSSPAPRPGTRLGIIALVSAALCVVSIVVLTALVPGQGSYPPNGGFLPLSSQGAR